jgi:hypothetical protein
MAVGGKAALFERFDVVGRRQARRQRGTASANDRKIFE